MEQLIAALNQALDLLDESTSIIQELLAQNQQLQSQKGGSKQSEQINKQAEVFASKTGLSYKEAEAMIKEAEQRDLPVDVVLEMMGTVAQKNNRAFASFGKVASEEPVYGSTNAETKFKELQQELLDELGLM